MKWEQSYDQDENGDITTFTYIIWAEYGLCCVWEYECHGMGNTVTGTLMGREFEWEDVCSNTGLEFDKEAETELREALCRQMTNQHAEWRKEEA